MEMLRDMGLPQHGILFVISEVIMVDYVVLVCLEDQDVL